METASLFAQSETNSVKFEWKFMEIILGDVKMEFV